MSSALHLLPDPEPDTSAPEEEDVAQLLFQIGQQDRRAFERLYSLWAPSLLGVALRILNNREEAEEAMQDTFVKIWHRAEEFDGKKSKPFVWCFTILRSICIDRIRHRRCKKRDQTKTVAWDDRDGDQADFDSDILGADAMQSVRKALEQLPYDERRCLELAVFLEYTQSEISDGTIKNRLRRAMAKLKATLHYHELK
jgi:RNA polymerase sigma-70 factor, ECF subfamily